MTRNFAPGLYTSKMATTDFTKPWNGGDLSFVFGTEDQEENAIEPTADGDDEEPYYVDDDDDDDDDYDVDVNDDVDDDDVDDDDVDDDDVDHRHHGGTGSNLKKLKTPTKEERKRVLYANKIIITMWSPVFKAMFSGNFKERNSVTITDKSFDDMLELMTVIHPPMKPITPDNVYTVLPLLHEYQIDPLVMLCESVLAALPYSFHHLYLADIYSLSSVEKGNIPKLGKYKTVNQMEADEYFSILSTDMRYRLLRYKSKAFEDKLTSDSSAYVVFGKSNSKNCSTDRQLVKFYKKLYEEKTNH